MHETNSNMRWATNIFRTIWKKLKTYRRPLLIVALTNFVIQKKGRVGAGGGRRGGGGGERWGGGDEGGGGGGLLSSSDSKPPKNTAA